MAINRERIKLALEAIQRRVPVDSGLDQVPWALVAERADKLKLIKASRTIDDCLSHLTGDELAEICLRGFYAFEEPKPVLNHTLGGKPVGVAEAISPQPLPTPETPLKLIKPEPNDRDKAARTPTPRGASAAKPNHRFRDSP